MPRPNTNQTLWNQIVADYRQACLLRREGRESEAARLINERLPVTIAAWSQADPRSAEDKKTALETMFNAEQMNIDSWLFAHQALATRLSESLIPALRQQVGEEIRQALADHPLAQSDRRTSTATRVNRIRFDDIPSVIDTLLAQQQADYGAKPAFAY